MPRWPEAATSSLARGLTLVYGGGRVGLMGALADAALAAGGRVVGVIPQMLIDREVGHAGPVASCTSCARCPSARLLMGDLSDAFLALPGGIGTMDELFEAWTWTQLRLASTSPCALLNQAATTIRCSSFSIAPWSEGSCGRATARRCWSRPM